MNHLLRPFALVLLVYTTSFSQTLYSPNERVILVNESARREDYINQAQKLLKPAGRLDVRVSQTNPSLLLIQDPNVAQLDKAPATLTQLGIAYPNWFETKRSSMADTSYCVHCAQSESSKGVSNRRPDPAGQLLQRRKSALVSMVKCCPTANTTQKERVAFIVVKGAGKVTIAELLEEASRLTTPRTVSMVRFNSQFPPQATPLLTTFSRQLTKRNRAVLRSAPILTRK